jgi:hypothetical protein
MPEKIIIGRKSCFGAENFSYSSQSTSVVSTVDFLFTLKNTVTLEDCTGIKQIGTFMVYKARSLTEAPGTETPVKKIQQM